LIFKFIKFADRVSVNVAAALTLMAGPFDTKGASTINIEITNPSGVDTLNAQLECATSAAGPWATMPQDLWKMILPGETRNEHFSKLAKNFMRLRGQSLGGTINSVTVSFHAESS
jgi:hypothetical protein